MMVEGLHVKRGKIEGSTYIFLSSDKTPMVRNLKYGLSDSEINRMIRKRKTCKVDPGAFVSSPWTEWLKMKNK